jgi:hypothetical protein
VPVEFANPVLCLMHGQAYLAGISLGRDLGSDDRIKIICVRTESAANFDAKQMLHDLGRWVRVKTADASSGIDLLEMCQG